MSSARLISEASAWSHSGQPAVPGRSEACATSWWYPGFWTSPKLLPCGGRGPSKNWVSWLGRAIAMGTQDTSQLPPARVLTMFASSVATEVAFTPKAVHCWMTSSAAASTCGPWLDG